MSYKRNDFSITAIVARMIGASIDRWPLVLIILFFVSPVGPHMRWEYTYRDTYGHRSYISCSYLGSRGLLPHRFTENCPFFAWIDARGARP